MKLSGAHFKRTLDTIAAMKFYPSGNDFVREEIMDLLSKMIDNPAYLEQFRCLLRDRVAEWPGLAELRAIYCTLRSPVDRIETVSSVPGFTGADLEREYVEWQSRESTKRIAEWKQKAIAAGDTKFLEAPISETEVKAAAERMKLPARPERKGNSDQRRAIADEYRRLELNQLAKTLRRIGE